VWSVRTAIDSLDPNEREVIRMKHLQGHSHGGVPFGSRAPTSGNATRPPRTGRRAVTQHAAHLNPEPFGDSQRSDDQEMTLRNRAGR
jgi:hypothetical protein